MNRRILSLLSPLLLLCAEAVYAQPAQPAAPAPYINPNDDYIVMQRELPLTDEQKANLSMKVAERNRAYEKWLAPDSGRRYQQYQKDLAEAHRQNDPDRIKDAEGKLSPLRAEELSTRADLRREFDTILTLEQQRQWAAYLLFINVSNRLNNVKLTFDQQKQAREACLKIATSAVQEDTFKEDPYLRLDEKSLDEATYSVVESVLTSEQTKRYPQYQRASTNPTTHP